MAQQTECIICYEVINDGDYLNFANCMHGKCIHTNCIQHWNGTCPLCREMIYDIRHNTNNIIDNQYYDIININNQYYDIININNQYYNLINNIYT